MLPISGIRFFVGNIPILGLIFQIFVGVTLARVGEWLFIAAVKTYNTYKAKADALDNLTKKAR